VEENAVSYGECGCFAKPGVVDSSPGPEVADQLGLEQGAKCFGHGVVIAHTAIAALSGLPDATAAGD